MLLFDHVASPGAPEHQIAQTEGDTPAQSPEVGLIRLQGRLDMFGDLL